MRSGRAAFWISLLWLVSGQGTRAQKPLYDFMVATNGSDAWTGKLAAPNAARTDGPFATVERARQAVRDLRTGEPQRKTPVVVALRGGDYALTAPFTLEPADSGTPDSPTMYTAYEKEIPTLSGGVRLTDWRVTNGRWQTTLPETQALTWNFTQLWVNGERRYRPHLPKAGAYTIAAVTNYLLPTPQTAMGRLRLNAGEFNPNWANRRDIELDCFQVWSMARLRVADFDPAANVATFTPYTIGLTFNPTLIAGNRYLIDNVKEALSKPGEWYLDRPTGVLTYLPKLGETPDKATVVAPKLDTLVRFAGDVGKRQWVHDITLRGLHFAYGNWNTPAEGNSTPLAEVFVPGTLTATGARNCTLENGSVAHVGAYAIALGQGCRNCRVDNMELRDMGTGGVRIGDTTVPTDPEAITSGCRVSNCLITQGGRLLPAGNGIWIGEAPGNRADHNTITDFYTTGIGVGWTFGYGESIARDDVIEFNQIDNIGQGLLSDMGGIYILGGRPGTVVRNNVISNVNSYIYGGWGIYFDEGTTGVVAENNLVVRAKSGGFHQHFGKDNVIRNNIFALSQEGQIERTKDEPHRSFTFERNIVYYTQGPLLKSNWNGNDYALDNNLYWNAAGRPLRFANLTWEQWRAKGQDAHSLVADPQFVNAGRGDFHLRPGSPALKVGFQPFDYTQAGRPNTSTLSFASANAALPEGNAFLPFPLPARMPVRALVESFDALPAGAKAPHATTNEENETDTIRVSGEQALSGNHSLKFVDGPGQKQPHFPNLVYDWPFYTGTVQARFALRVGPNASFYGLCKDNAKAFHAGPWLWVHEDGSVTANDQKLMTIPLNRWVTFELTVVLGDQADGTYEATIELPDGTHRRFPGLKCDPDFVNLEQLLFVSNGTQPTEIYLDDLSLKPL